MTARCNPVLPTQSWELGFAPFSIKSLTLLWQLAMTAKCSGNALSTSLHKSFAETPRVSRSLRQFELSTELAWWMIPWMPETLRGLRRGLYTHFKSSKLSVLTISSIGAILDSSR